MALQRIPRATLHRSSLANISRIIKLNMLDLGVNADLIKNYLPTLVPHNNSVALFFRRVAFLMDTLGPPTAPFKLDVQYYRNDINSALQIIRLNMAVEAGVPIPGSAPIFNVGAPIADSSTVVNVAMTPIDTSTAFTGGAPTAYKITALTEGMVIDTSTGIISGTPTSISSYNPLVTASNSFGSAQSNVFNIITTATVIAVDLNKDAKPPKAKKKTKSKSK